MKFLRTRAGRAGLVALGVLACAVPAAQAAWSGPETVATAGSGEHVLPEAVALSDAGVTTAYYDRSSTPFHGADFFSDRPAGGTFGPSTSAPAVLGAAGPRGDQVALCRRGPKNNRPAVCYRPAGGSWGAPEKLDRGIRSVAFIVDAAGNAVIVGTGAPGGAAIPWAKIYDAAAGTWGPTVILDPTGLSGQGNLGSELAVDDNGHVFVAYRSTFFHPHASTSEIDLVTGDLATGTWSAPQTVATDIDQNAAPAIGANAAGGVTIAWATPQDVVEIDRPTLGGAFGPVTTVATKQKPDGIVHVAEDAAGDVTLVWVGKDRIGDPLNTVERAAGGGLWSPVQTLAAPVDFRSPVSQADADGGVAIAYASAAGLQALVKPSIGAGWSAPAVFPGLFPQAIDLNASGTAVIETENSDATSVGVLTYTP